MGKKKGETDQRALNRGGPKEKLKTGRIHHLKRTQKKEEEEGWGEGDEVQT